MKTFACVLCVTLLAAMGTALPGCQEVPLDQNSQNSFDHPSPSTGMQGFHAMDNWGAGNGNIGSPTPFSGGFKGF